MFAVKRPCSNCPFRKGNGAAFRLRQRRIEGINDAVAFQCHKTIDKTPQQCAGLMSMQIRNGHCNAITRLAIETGFVVPSEIDPDREAYETVQAAIRSHTRHADAVAVGQVWRWKGQRVVIEELRFIGKKYLHKGDESMLLRQARVGRKWYWDKFILVNWGYVDG